MQWGVAEGVGERSDEEVRPRRWPLLILMTVAAAVVAVGAWLVWSFVNDPFADSCGLSDAETLAWAGFSVSEDVSADGVRSECWLDQSVRFTIRGAPEVIERILDDAEFGSTFVPGVGHPVQESLFDADAVAALTQVESAGESREWTSDGWVSRQVVRGDSASGSALLVAAYGN